MVELSSPRNYVGTTRPIIVMRPVVRQRVLVRIVERADPWSAKMSRMILPCIDVAVNAYRARATCSSVIVPFAPYTHILPPMQ
jgi:hypothetical protein